MSKNCGAQAAFGSATGEGTIKVNEHTANQQHLVVTQQRDIIGLPFDLVTRGLSDSEIIQVTPQDIADARIRNEGFQNLSNLAIKIALEQASYWQSRFFAQLLSDRIQTFDDLLGAVLTRKVSDVQTKLEREEMLDWAGRKVKEFSALMKSGNSLAVEKFPAEIVSIIEIAEKWSAFYSEMLEWSKDILAIETEPKYTDYVQKLSYMAVPCIVNFGNYCVGLRSRIENWLLLDHETRGQLNCELSLKVYVDPTIVEEMDHLAFYTDPSNSDNGLRWLTVS